MSKCRFFWQHDYERVNEKNILTNLLHRHLEVKGFERIDRIDSITYWRNSDGVCIFEWGFCDGDYLEECIPHDVASFVCLKCGYSYKNYDVNKSLDKLDRIIADKTKQRNRELLADKLLGR